MKKEIEIPLGEILKPTEKEFKDFKSYIYKVFTNPKYKDCGVIKIIPPKNLSFPLPKINKINKLEVRNPILQELYGSNGVYQLKLICQKSVTMKDYKSKVDRDEKKIKNFPIEKKEKFVK
jgi:hypothetical protein